MAEDPAPSTSNSTSSEVVHYSEAEALALGLTCDFVTAPNGKQYPCVNGKPPVIPAECDNCIPYAPGELPAGRFPWGVSNVHVQEKPTVYETSTLSLNVRYFPISGETGQGLPPVISIDGRAQESVSFRDKTATYRIRWPRAGLNWLSITDFPNDVLIPVNVQGRAARVQPDILMGLNQFLRMQDGKPVVSADALIASEPGKRVVVQDGSLNIATGGVSAPGQPWREQDWGSSSVRDQVERWLTYPMPTGTMRASYSVITKVRARNKIVATKRWQFNSDAVALTTTPDGAVGPAALVPRFELPRALLAPEDGCQAATLTFTYSGDINYEPAQTSTEILVCPERRS